MNSSAIWDRETYRDTEILYEKSSTLTPSFLWNYGITLANLPHIFFDSYSADTQNINGTKLKINVII